MFTELTSGGDLPRGFVSAAWRLENIDELLQKHSELNLERLQNQQRSSDSCRVSLIRFTKRREHMRSAGRGPSGTAGLTPSGMVMKTKNFLVSARKIVIPLAISLMAGSLVACAPSRELTYVAIVAGDRQGVPSLFDKSGSSGSALVLPSFVSALEEQTKHDLALTVLAVDGNPQPAASMELRVDSTNPKTAERSISENTGAMATAILSSKAKTPESNLLLALDSAGRSVMGQQNSNVFVVDSGISTTGPLMFQTGLIGPQTDAAKIVDQLRSAGNLPSMKGVNVQWWGLGQVAGPQAAVPIWTNAKLRELYTLIIQASGGTVVFHNDLIPPTAPTLGLPKVTSVTFTDTVAAPISVPLPESRLMFEKESAEFTDPVAAAKSIGEVASEFSEATTSEIWVTGCTAFPPGASVAGMERLSTKRAQAVRAELVNSGLSNVHARGFGPNCPGRIPDVTADGKSIPDAQAQNRKVLVTSEKIQPVSAR